MHKFLVLREYWVDSTELLVIAKVKQWDWSGFAQKPWKNGVVLLRNRESLKWGPRSSPWILALQLGKGWGSAVHRASLGHAKCWCKVFTCEKKEPRGIAQSKCFWKSYTFCLGAHSLIYVKWSSGFISKAFLGFVPLLTKFGQSGAIANHSRGTTME